MKLLLKNHKIVSLNQIYSMGHWSKRKKLADGVHNEIFWAIKEQGLKAVNNYPTHLFFGISQKRYKDLDNVAVKLYVDGLKLAGVLKDDNPNYINSLTIISRGNKVDEVEIGLL